MQMTLLYWQNPLMTYNHNLIFLRILSEVETNRQYKPKKNKVLVFSRHKVLLFADSEQQTINYQLNAGVDAICKEKIEFVHCVQNMKLAMNSVHLKKNYLCVLYIVVGDAVI